MNNTSRRARVFILMENEQSFAIVLIVVGVFGIQRATFPCSR